MEQMQQKRERRTPGNAGPDCTQQAAIYVYRDTAVFLLGPSDAGSCEQAEAHVEHHGRRVPAQAFSHALPLPPITS